MKDKIFRALALLIIAYLLVLMGVLAIFIDKCDYDRDCIEKATDPYVFIMLVMLLTVALIAMVAYFKSIVKTLSDWVIKG